MPVFLKTGTIRRFTMKNVLIAMLFFIAVMAAFNVQAASVDFEPSNIKLTIAPGKTGRTAIAVHGFSSSAYSLNFLMGSRFKNGNIPHGWLTAAYLWLDAKAQDKSSCTMDLVVTVPADAKPGVYSGVLVPDDMRSSEPINSPGVILAIEVAGH